MADFTIADVLAWARTKPADERYNYWCNQCAIGQFLVETGRAASEPEMAQRRWRTDDVEGDIPEEIDAAAYAGYDGDAFGAFVKRLEALCPETPVTTSNWQRIDAYLADIEQVPA